MPDTIVASQQTTPPSIYMTPTLADQLAAWKAALLTATIWLKLFLNEITVSAATVLSDLEEAQAPGYAPIAVTTLNGPFLDASGNAYLTTPEALWTCSGGGTDLEYGAYLVEATGAAATVTFTLSSGSYTDPVIGSGGTGYLVAPRVTVTGDTGSGAVLTATITDGVVTAINIINAGTAYTTVTATIEPPLKLVQAVNFPQARPLQLSTDAIPYVLELDMLAA